MADIPFGAFRWLTVTSTHGITDVELVLEPMSFEPVRAYQRALFAAGMSAIALITTDVQADFTRLTAAGVVFHGTPSAMGPITAVSFEDTCGNLVNLVQPA